MFSAPHFRTGPAACRRHLPSVAILLFLAAGALAAGAPAAPITAQTAGAASAQGSIAASSVAPSPATSFGDNEIWGANWKLAARFAPYKVRGLTHSTSVSPRWIGETDRFWYQWEDSDGTFFYVVDPARASKQQIFDNDRLAAELTRITGDPFDGQHLPIRNIQFLDENTLQFEVQSTLEEEVVDEAAETGQTQQEQRRPSRPRTRAKVFHFEYDVSSRTLRELEDWEEPRTHPGWASVAPDSSVVVFSRECNLYTMGWDDYMKIVDARHGKTGAAVDSAEAAVEVDETQLTTDGEKDYCYGSSGRGQTDDEVEEEWGKRQGAGVTWSHDSGFFAMIRRDQREMGDLWVIHSVGNERPQLETYKYDLGGEEHVAQYELLVYDLQAGEMKRIDDDPWKDQTMGIFSDSDGGGRDFAVRSGEDDEPRIRKWFSPSPNELYFSRKSRDEHRVDVLVADPATGEVKVLIEERLNTYVENQSPTRLENGDFIWWSERDGWAHLYRYGADGTLKARLTEGPFHVSGVAEVDEDRGYVFFNANNREEGEDPYYGHLYRVNLDGSGLTLLNPGDFDHRASVSESGHYFVDNFSRVNTIPAATLHDAAGRRVMELETADFTALEASGYQFPEPFKVEAADGVTDIYGVMYKPFDFDPARKYPIVAYVYPGPQTESVAKAWSSSSTEVALAQMGMIVITIGNRGGNPDRSKWYHNYGYGNLRDYGLADKKVGIEQLADRFDFIDVDRVGIYGHSGGGFMSTAAMLVYPDFFKVAVSSSGNHDNDVYGRYWSEKHDGVKEVVGRDGEITFEYDIDRNSDLAANLKGHLLLTTGDIDNNVHPASTFRVAAALIRANKRFDFFLFPGQRHSYGNMNDYFFWLRAEYFAKWLLGDERTAIDVMELNNEVAQSRGQGR